MLKGLNLIVRAQLVGNQKENRGTEVSSFAYQMLGVLFADQGKLAEAEKMYQRALEEKEKALGPEHTSTLDTVNNLGLLYSDQGKLTEAEKMYQQALEGNERALGTEHTSTLNTVVQLCNVYVKQCFSYLSLRNTSRAKIWRPSSDQNRLQITITSALLLYGKWGKTKRSLFGQLGRMLLLAGDPESAIVAFKQQVDVVDGEFQVSEFCCDGCGAGFQLPSIRYVCRSCEDVDLCSGCYLAYQLEGLLENHLALGCQDHDFLAVPRDQWSSLPSEVFLVDGITARDWILQNFCKPTVLVYQRYLRMPKKSDSSVARNSIFAEHSGIDGTSI